MRETAQGGKGGQPDLRDLFALRVEVNRADQAVPPLFPAFVPYTGSVERLQELCEDLWNRWREAFGRFGDQAPGSGERAVYANVPLFDLKNYTPRKFPAGGRMLQNLREMATSYHVYWLDSNGLPVNMACRHVVNNVDWQGFYLYNTHEDRKSVV